MAKFLNIVRVVLPILLQAGGWVLTLLAAVQAGKAAESGKFSLGQQISTVGTNGAIGVGLIGTGVVLHQHNLSKAKEELPTPPDGVSDVLHLLSLTQQAMNVSRDATGKDLDAMNDLIKVWRSPTTPPQQLPAEVSRS